MGRLGQILSRTFFWSYDRGTWQFDLAVILILVFVLLTPRTWFHDKPESGAPTVPGQVELLSATGDAQTYRVDLRALAPPTKLALQSDLRTALQGALPELRTTSFSISHIEPIKDERGTVVAYRVEIRH
jgi:hypothetical protein